MNHLVTPGDTGATFGRLGPRSTLEQLRDALEADGERLRPTRISLVCPCGTTTVQVAPADTAEDVLEAVIARRRCGERHIDR